MAADELPSPEQQRPDAQAARPNRLHELADRSRVLTRRPQSRDPRWIAMLLVLIAFVIVVRTEIAALIAEVPVQSQTYSPAGLDNLLHPNGSGTAFAAWATVPCPPNGANLAGWLQ